MTGVLRYITCIDRTEMHKKSLMMKGKYQFGDLRRDGKILTGILRNKYEGVNWI
jgi:hypothetical protein